MNEQDKSTQNMLSNIDLKQFESITQNAMLTDEQVQILIMFFKGKSIGFIADHMGYSIRSIKRKKQLALKKIALSI